MTSKEALEELYKEREYLLAEKVNNKTKNWHNDITHYDNINHCLLTIKQDLNRLDILKKYLYYDNKNHTIKMKEIRKSTLNFDYEDLKEVVYNAI